MLNFNEICKSCWQLKVNFVSISQFSISNQIKMLKLTFVLFKMFYYVIKLNVSARLELITFEIRSRLISLQFIMFEFYKIITHCLRL